MYQYDTVVGALNGLKERGYTTDFNLAFDKIECRETGVCLNPSEFEIIEMHRFEGNTNPSDEDVVYAIESTDGKMKGVLSSAFGTYADSTTNEMVKKLSMHTH